MNQLLSPKQIIQLDTNLYCEIEKFIGGGGQGEVYQANLNGKLVALKWYFPEQATEEQYHALEMLINSGAPNDKFLWPLSLATAPQIRSFGYVMPLRGERYKSINDLMKRRIDPSFRVLATVGLELAHSFLQLHAKGFCYRDISFGNVFFDPDTGEVLICDNDNVTLDGDASGGVLGTPRFMAPEVVRGEAKPSIETDLFSLAVLLFYMFMIHHPLEGKKEAKIRCFDLPAMNKLYGTEPVFIFDPNDKSNAPILGYHDNAIIYWNLYPRQLRDLFTKAFTSGIYDTKQGRIRESEWCHAMIALRDSIIYCGDCGAENFYEPDMIHHKKGKLCWSCQKLLKLPPRIRIDHNIIMLNYDTKLFNHHIDPDKNYDFSEVIASVNQHPDFPDVWGLKNHSSETWHVTTVDGVTTKVHTGQNVKIALGIKINFGKTTGEIKL
jgi:serine/threonine protein kinase